MLFKCCSDVNVPRGNLIVTKDIFSLQENVSCLNTALIFFMFALDKGYLPLYLKAFRSEEAALNKPGFILDNLRYKILIICSCNTSSGF